MENRKIIGFSLASWGAIFAGVVVILAIEMMLGMLGLAFGLWNVDPAQGEVPFQALSIGAAIWWVISSIIAVFLGAWVSGYMANQEAVLNSVLHGVVTWAVAALLSVFVLTAGVGALTAGAVNVVTSSLETMGGAITQTFQTITQVGLPQNIQKDIQEVLDRVRQQAQQAEQDIDVSRQKLMSAIQKILAKPAQSLTEADKQSLVRAITQATDMSEAEASSTVNRLISHYQGFRQQMGETMQKAQKLAGQTAQSMGTAAFWSFIMFLLTLAIAVAGGAAGAKKRV